MPLTNSYFSPVIAGCMRWGAWGAAYNTAALNTLVIECIENGITTFDHADIYGNYTTEADFGKVLQQNVSLRANMQLITKCGIQMLTENRPLHNIKSYNISKEHIITSVENSLRNLHTNYIDALLIHRPSPLMNPQEIAEAVTALMNAGKILHFGISNFSSSQAAFLRSFIPISIHQFEYNTSEVSTMYNGVLDDCIVHKMVAMSWSPLKSIVNWPNDENSNVKWQSLLEKYNTDSATLQLAFILKHPAKMLPVVGSTKASRIIAAKKAYDIPLITEDWFRILQIIEGKEVA